jgi:hypothetical protein
MFDDSTFDPPLTAEENSQREANRRKPLTAGAIATIEADIMNAANDGKDYGMMLLDACLLLREVKRLLAPEGTHDDRRISITVSGCGAPPHEMSYDLSSADSETVRVFASVDEHRPLAVALRAELRRRMGIESPS